MSGFEEWLAGYHRLDDGWELNIARDAWSACETAMNREAGWAANEAGKVERRKVAVEALSPYVSIMCASMADYSKQQMHMERLDAIIKAAQG